VKNDGNVGIGTDSPSEALDVSGNIYINNGATSGTVSQGGQLIFDAGTGEGGPNKIKLYGYNSPYGFGTAAYTLKYHSYANHKFYSGSTGTSDGSFNMILDQNGNLGIGTDSPSEALDVSGNTKLQGNINVTGATQLDSTLDVTGATQLDSTLDVSGGVAIGSSYNAPTNGMIVEGNVGIGTTSPNKKLHVKGNDGVLCVQGGNTVYMEFAPGTGTDPTNPRKVNTTTISEGTRAGYMGYGGSTTHHLGIVNELDGGDLYLNAKNLIHLDGNVQATNITASNDITANQFIAYSDRNLKQNIVPIECALDKVCRLEGVHYEFKNAPDVKRMGLIAQDVEKIIPEVVSENNEGTKGIDYGPIVSILIESVKELKEENIKLNKKIEDMQK
jgi:hypothetical protein